jgi:hypothetical protein
MSCGSYLFSAPELRVHAGLFSPPVVVAKVLNVFLCVARRRRGMEEPGAVTGKGHSLVAMLSSSNLQWNDYWNGDCALSSLVK